MQMISNVGWEMSSGNKGLSHFSILISVNTKSKILLKRLNILLNYCTEYLLNSSRFIK